MNRRGARAVNDELVLFSSVGKNQTSYYISLIVIFISQLIEFHDDGIYYRNQHQISYDNNKGKREN